MRPHGVILAGGAGRRLGGGDKPLRPLGGRCLLDHVVDRVAPQVAELALSANGDPARFAAWPLAVLADAVPGRGPLAGLLAGLIWAGGQGAAWLLCVPGDTPFLPRTLGARLAAAQAASGRSIAHAACNGISHPAVALVATDLAPDLAQRLDGGVRAVREWFAPHAPVVVTFADTRPDAFMNLNTPADFVAAEGWLRPG